MDLCCDKCQDLVWSCLYPITTGSVCQLVFPFLSFSTWTPKSSPPHVLRSWKVTVGARLIKTWTAQNGWSPFTGHILKFHSNRLNLWSSPNAPHQPMRAPNCQLDFQKLGLTIKFQFPNSFMENMCETFVSSAFCEILSETWIKRLFVAVDSQGVANGLCPVKKG